MFLLVWNPAFIKAEVRQKEDRPFLRQTKSPRAFPAIRKKRPMLLRPASCAAMNEAFGSLNA